MTQNRIMGYLDSLYLLKEYNVESHVFCNQRVFSVIFTLCSLLVTEINFLAKPNLSVASIEIFEFLSALTLVTKS